ncbi:hypothetical protein [Janthinobacterium sp. LB3P112]|uniref:hypothetical protein n=1 Tax=Janthinobacterium sp. LB3P112 TaxID=3424196 RepID=UPI003F21B03E
MQIPDRCINDSKDKIVVCGENGRAFRLNNKGQLSVSKILVDDCLITGGEIRCDYLLEVAPHQVGKGVAIYVELKGIDIKHAVNQLENTLNKLKVRHADYTKKCFVVSSRVPRSSINIQMVKVKFMQKWKSSFDVKNIMAQVEL